MVLAHELTIGTFDGGLIVRGFYAKHVAGIFQRRTTLRLLSCAARRLLVIPAAKLRATLHHAQELIELHTGDTQLFRNHV